MKVGEFFVDLGIKASGATTLKDFLGTMGRMRLSTLGTIGALGTVGTYMAGVLDNTSNAAIAFQKFSNQTGLSAQELQRWQIAARQVNVSADDVSASVSNLQRNLAGIRLGQGDVSPFQILGVSPLGDAFQVLKELRTARTRVSPAQFTRQTAAMGLAPSMMNVLALGEDEFQKFLGTARGMTPEVQTGILQMTEAFNQLWLKIRDINFELAELASGPVTEVLTKVLRELNSPGQGKAARGFQAAAAVFDVGFGTNLAAFLRKMNLGYARQQEIQRQYQILVRTDPANAPAYADFAKQLEEQLNAIEAQTPVPERK